MSSASFANVGFRFLITGLVGIGSIYAALGRMVAEKIATIVVMPAGLLWLFLLFSASWAVAIRQKAAAACLMVCWMIFSIIGSGYVADRLAKSLEGPYLTIDPLKEEPFEAIVLLGGGGGVGANGRVQGNGSGDRMLLAAQMYHQGLTKKLICTGQRIETMDSSGVDPAEVSRLILTSLGVPDSAIEKLGGRNTSEEMIALGERFGESKDDVRVGLITSAWHLPRALRLAGKQGFYPSPLPADFRSSSSRGEPTSGELIEAMIPSGNAFSLNSALMKEYLGILLGR
ncbi:MAG: YdcF family protein [Planctomyces sp.]|jgi:uncharacterized SAM-binding protein YcdF (DUF218 family)